MIPQAILIRKKDDQWEQRQADNKSQQANDSPKPNLLTDFFRYRLDKSSKRAWPGKKEKQQCDSEGYGPKKSEIGMPQGNPVLDSQAGLP